MKLNEVLNKSIRTVKLNSPEILTGLGVAGVPITAYLVARASFKAARTIQEEPEGKRIIAGVPYKEEELPFKTKAKLVWKHYIPAGVAGAATMACIIGSSKASGQRTAAAVTAYSLTERAFSEYKEHVIEEIGKNKEQKIHDEIAQKTVTENPPTKEVIIGGRGEVLCCELRTRRYFKSDMETIRKAMNDVNAWVVHEGEVAMDEFYDLLGLEHTSESDRMGWDSDKLLDLKFSTTLAPGGEPCLAFDYTHLRKIR